MRFPSALALLALSIPAFAADLYVEAAGTDTTNDCLVSGTPCGTIAHAVSLAVTGDVVYVGAGDFSSTAATYPIFVGAGITLQGAGHDGSGTNIVVSDTVTLDAFYFEPISGSVVIRDLHISGAPRTLIDIDANTDGGPVDVLIDQVLLSGNMGGGDLLDIGANTGSAPIDITVRNTIIRGGGGGLYADFGLMPRGSLILEGNTISGVGWDCIEIDVGGGTTNASSAVAQYDIVLADNTCTAPGDLGIDLDIDGEALATVTLVDNTVSSASSTGILMVFSDTADIALHASGNVVTDAGDDGITVLVMDYTTLWGDVSGNTITGAGSSGLEVYASDTTGTIDLTIAGNTVSGNYDGMTLAITDSSYNAVRFDVVGNTIIDNIDDGIELYNTAVTDSLLTVELRSNTIEGNGGDGVYIYNSYGGFYGHFYGNVITNNSEHGIYVGATDDVGFRLGLEHNTITGNAENYTAGGFYDFDNEGNSFYDVIALDNWWGTTDAALIDAHIYDQADSSSIAAVHYTALSATLEFSLVHTAGSESGGSIVVIEALADAPPFVPTAGIKPLLVQFDGVASPNVEVAGGGRRLYAELPPHAPGMVEVSVYNPGGQFGSLGVAFEYLADFVDTDADSVEDAVDNCPGVANGLQEDADSDGIGDACDLDADGDGVPDADEVGDVDGDTVPDDTDNCVNVANSAQTDTDSDGIGDACDLDADGNGTPDTEEYGDMDGDTVLDNVDNCPGVENTDQADEDGDGVGDACDLNADGNGVADVDEVEDHDGEDDDDDGGCGCSTTPSAPATGSVLLLLAGLLGLRRRQS